MKDEAASALHPSSFILHPFSSILSPPVMPRVLVIDDDPSIAETLRQALAPWHIDVATATGVQSAMELLLTGTFIGVVLDLMISHGKSFDVLDAMRHANINTRVIVTATRVPAFVNYLLNPMQVLTIMRKPVDPELMVAAILGLGGTEPGDAARSASASGTATDSQTDL
jgi:DNA-binding NtrC family response regulator